MFHYLDVLTQIDNCRSLKGPIQLPNLGKLVAIKNKLSLLIKLQLNVMFYNVTAFEGKPKENECK